MCCTLCCPAVKTFLPLLELRIFKSHNFTLGTILLIFAYGSMLSVSTLIPIYIQNLRHYSATISGLVLLPGALFLAFLNPLCGRILDKKGPYILSLAGLALLGVQHWGFLLSEQKHRL
ncbi:MFS transporter [Blautia sp. RD014234]|nr:MFS transporter [Blautia parvula]